MDDATLTRTLAGLLATRAGWAWRPTGPAYTTAEVGVFYGRLAGTPDRACGIAVYGVTDPLHGDAATATERRVQLRFRGPRDDPAGADDLAHAAYTALHGLGRVSGLALIRREFAAPMGTDDVGRRERADTYTVTLDNQES